MSLSNLQLPSKVSPPVAGLSTEEAARRLAQAGPNAVVEEHEHGLKRMARHFWAPVPWMLEATIVLQIAIGKHIEALMIGALLIFNVVLSVFQENRAEAALALLKQRLSLKARVKRDGSWVELPAAILVPGDVVQLSLGVVVPGDVRIIEGSVLLDQSMLTGESIPVDAGPDETAYAGALVRRGEAIAWITATGASTYFGRAAELVRIAHVESTEVKVVISLVRNLSVVNAALVIGLVVYANCDRSASGPDHSAHTDRAALRGSGCAAGHFYLGRRSGRENGRAQGRAVDTTCRAARGCDDRRPVRRQDWYAY